MIDYRTDTLTHPFDGNRCLSSLSSVAYDYNPCPFQNTKNIIYKDFLQFAIKYFIITQINTVTTYALYKKYISTKQNTIHVSENGTATINISYEKPTPVDINNKLTNDLNKAAADVLKSSQDAITEIHFESGLEWEEFAEIFEVDRQTIYFWESGKSMDKPDLARLRNLLFMTRWINRGNFSNTRAALRMIFDVPPRNLFFQPRLINQNNFGMRVTLITEPNANVFLTPLDLIKISDDSLFARYVSCLVSPSPEQRETIPPLSPLSEEEQAARRPLPPHILACAIPDTVPEESSPIRIAKTIKGKSE